MVTRRTFIVRAVSTVASAAVGSFIVDPLRASLALPPGIGLRRDYEGPLPEPVLGREPPNRAEIELANRILSSAPHGPTPYDVARHFLKIARGDFGVDKKPFASGWPDRWNPVIVEFFRATGTVPEGDTTSWCAAFLNWCFARVRASQATGSASSGSFRCFGSVASRPILGDVVVFRRADSHDPCIGKGHVGFFVGQDASRILVLGGNQIDGHDGSHMVSAKWLSKNGSILKLHSVRTDVRLHVQKT